MNEFKTLELFGYSIFTSKLEQINVKSKSSINTLNQYSYVIAERDPVFKEALMSSDILLPDGVGIVAAALLIKNKSIRKIAGADLHKYLLLELSKVGGRCFYLGSSQNTLDKIKKQLKNEYPNIQASFFSPPFKPAFTDADNAEMIKAVNEFKPDVLFVGMTAPKQEKWVHENKDKVDTNIVCSIGAVFDFYAGTVNRPSQFWIKIGMEWMVRLSNEPKRMWKRYLYYGPVFIAKILKRKLADTSSK